MFPDHSVDYEDVVELWDEEDIAGYREVIEANEDEVLAAGYVMVGLDRVTAEALLDGARVRCVEPGRLAAEILRGVLIEEQEH